MNRRLGIVLIVVFCSIGAVFAGDYSVESWHKNYAVSVDYDTVGDTVADGRNYYDLVIPLNKNVGKFNSGKFQIIIGAATPVIHGFGNDDSALVTMVSTAANMTMYTTSTANAAIPCTTSFTWNTNDTLYGDQIYFNVRCVDSTADTAFTTYYPITVRWMFRGD